MWRPLNRTTPKQIVFIASLLIFVTFSYGDAFEEENLNSTSPDSTTPYTTASTSTTPYTTASSSTTPYTTASTSTTPYTTASYSNTPESTASNGPTTNAFSLSQCPMHKKPADCEEVLENGYTENGIYHIWPKSRVTQSQIISVYCDMKTMGGGWTLIQRRGDFGNPEDYFKKSWNQYKIGFGKLRLEFWLGNDKIYALTNQQSYSIRFELTNRNGISKYAMYDHFWIDEEEQKYKLHLGNYAGDAGDALGPHNLKEFYTYDRDGNGHSGGWWYNIFPSSNLNGLNKKSDFGGRDNIMWDPFGGYVNSLLTTEIKIRSNRI